jgi:hypothetical protein
MKRSKENIQKNLINKSAIKMQNKKKKIKNHRSDGVGDS